MVSTNSEITIVIFVKSENGILVPLYNSSAHFPTIFPNGEPDHDQHVIGLLHSYVLIFSMLFKNQL